MKNTLQRHAAQATKVKLISAALVPPTAAPAARSWSAPDPGVFTPQQPVEASKAKPEALDRRMVAELAWLTRP